MGHIRNYKYFMSLPTLASPSKNDEIQEGITKRNAGRSQTTLI